MTKKIIRSSYFFEEDLESSLAEVPIKPGQPWPDSRKLKYIGKPINRIEGLEKVTGIAKYTFDIQIKNMAYAVVLRSPHPHAKITALDDSWARKINGVIDVISFQNTEEIPWFYNTTKLFDKHLRFAGDEIACVLAESRGIAEQAVKKIEVRYETLPHVVDPQQALETGAPHLFKEGNRGRSNKNVRGDADAAFRTAKKAGDPIVENTFATQVAIHNPLEVHCSVVKWEGDKLTIWDSTQGIYRVRSQVADSLGIPYSNVRVIKKYMGGGFGSKLEAGKYTVMAALLAKKRQRPVKIALDRREMHLATGNRPDSIQKLKAAADKSGRLLALSHHSIGSSGAYPGSAACSWPLRTLYKCDHVKILDESVYINAGRARPFRAPGHVQGTFAFESLIDDLAEKVGIDPLEFRRINFSKKDPNSNLPYTSNYMLEAYTKGAEAIGWNRRNKIPGAGKGQIKRGIGMASQIWWGGGGPPAYATINLNRDGSAEVLCGTQDLGTGTYTIIAQTAAEVLQIPIEKIRVVLGDTATTPYAPSSGGSVTAPSIAPAVKDAAEQLRSKLMDAAATILENGERELVFDEGKIFIKESPDQSITIEKIIQELRERVLTATGARNANPEDQAINTFGAQFADVSVDTDTGLVKVNKIVAANDIGRVLNRQTMESQFYGGIMQGLGFALMEERIMDAYTGTMVNPNMHDYKIPTMLDVPEIEVFIVSKPDHKISSVGAKGTGEPAIIPTAGAIANAVYNAIGVRVYSLPITPGKVLSALRLKKRNGSGK